MATPDADRGERLARVAVFALPFLACVAGGAGIVGANAGSHYALVRALVDQRRLAIDDYAEYTYGVDFATRAGRVYTNKSPFTALFAAPFYAVGRTLGPLLPTPRYTVGVDPGNPATFYVLLFPALASAGGSLLTFVLCRRLGATPAAAALASAVLAFGTLHWRYGTALFAHAPAAALVLGAALVTVAAVDLRRQPGAALLLGLLCGLAVATEYTNAVVVPVVLLGAILGHKLGRPRAADEAVSLAVLVVAAAAPLVVLAAYNHACFGSVWSTSYTYAAGPATGQGVAELAPGRLSLPGFRAPLAAGLRDLLWGGDKVTRGLLTVSPVLVLTPLSLAIFWPRAWAAALLLAAAPAALLFTLARYRIYWGGTTGDTRYLQAVVPLLCIPLAFWWDHWRARRSALALSLRALMLALAVVSIAGGIRAVATFDGHPIRELRLPASLWDLRLNLAAVFPGAWGVPVALGWLLLGGLVLSLLRRPATGAAGPSFDGHEGSQRAGRLTPAARWATLAVTIPLLWLSPALRGAGPPSTRRWEYSADGRTWMLGAPPLSADSPVLRARWFWDQPPGRAAILTLSVGECLASARVNKTLRLSNADCPPGASPATTRLDVTNFVSPGLNLVELEVRARRQPAVLHDARVEAP